MGPGPSIFSKPVSMRIDVGERMMLRKEGSAEAGHSAAK